MYDRRGVSAPLCKLNNFVNESQNFVRKMTKLLLKGIDSCLPHGEKNIRYEDAILPS